MAKSNVSPDVTQLKASGGGGIVQEERLLMRLYGLLQLSHRQKQQLASRWRSWKRRRAALSGALAVAQHTLDDNLPTCVSANLYPIMQIVDAVLRPGCDSARLSNLSFNLKFGQVSQVHLLGRWQSYVTCMQRTETWQ